METTGAGGRDYSSISPSARALLMMKGLTPIPFAKEAAALMASRGDDAELVAAADSLAFWGRVLHFESRYQSIDQLLADESVKNVLELSSGFSFRGLQMVRQQGIHYVDTDLPEVIAVKKDFVQQMQREAPAGEGSRLEMLPLNALDGTAFSAVINRFSDGPLAIVNEGLLMYLGAEEKVRLCSSIHSALQTHGGGWITARVYQTRL